MARIMVVDDVAAIREILTALLQDAGHRVLEAKNGEEALTFAETKRVHLVLTDINMPGINGLDLIKSLRQQKNYSHTPILILANDSNDENIEKAKELGACGWVAKPFKPENLIGVINQVLVDYYVTN